MPSGMRLGVARDIRRVVENVRADRAHLDTNQVAKELRLQLGIPSDNRLEFNRILGEAIEGGDVNINRLQEFISGRSDVDVSRIAALDVDRVLQSAYRAPGYSGPDNIGDNYRNMVSRRASDSPRTTGRSTDRADVDNAADAKITNGKVADAYNAARPQPRSDTLSALAKARLEAGESASEVFRTMGPEFWNDIYKAVIAGPTAPAETRAIAADALRLFASLPKITPEMAPQELVEMGILKKLPDGWERMDQTPRYIPGRQVMVQTHINTNFGNPKSFGEYLATGSVGLTHRATLVGERGDNFLVEIDGRAEPVEISKQVVAALNQPQQYGGGKFSVNGVIVDYNDPYMKMNLYFAFTHLGKAIERMDFRQAFAKEANHEATITSKTEVFDLQQRLVSTLHNMVNMEYSHDLNSGESAARLAIKGSGQCYSQAAVMAALLAPFSKVIGIDVQYVNGQVYRDADPTRSGYPYNGSNHGWLQITYRPVGVTRITDRTWVQPNIGMDEAYSYIGDRVPRQLMPVNGRDRAQASFSAADVDFSGQFVLPKKERSFGVRGVHDRSNHQ